MFKILILVGWPQLGSKLIWQLPGCTGSAWAQDSLYWRRTHTLVWWCIIFGESNESGRRSVLSGWWVGCPEKGKVLASEGRLLAPLSGNWGMDENEWASCQYQYIQPCTVKIAPSAKSYVVVVAVTLNSHLPRPAEPDPYMSALIYALC